MSLSINTNASALTAIQVLNQTTDELNATENAVSTGKSVSSASDSPAIYSISQSMNSQISALSGVGTGLSFAAQVIKTGASQVSTISSILSDMSSTVTNAANNGENQDTLNTQLTQSLSEISAATENATFQGVNLISGTTGAGVTYTHVSAAQDVNGNLFTVNGYNATASGLGLDGLSTTMKGATIDLGLGTTFTTTAGTATNLTLENQAKTGAVASSASDPAITSQFILDAKATGVVGSDIATALNGALTTTGSVTSVNSDGTLAITATNLKTTTKESDGSTIYTLKDGDTITASQDASGNNTYSVVKAADRDANGNALAETNIVDVDVSSVIGASTDTTSLNTDIENTLVKALVKALGNAGFGASVDSDTGTLTIAGGNLDASDANVATAVKLTGATAGTGRGAGTLAVSNTTGTAVVQLAVNAAIDKLDRISASLGVATNTVSELQTSNSALSDALTIGVGDLTDADLSAESAKLTSLQTKQELAIQALSIANSQSSTLLTLFKG